MRRTRLGRRSAPGCEEARCRVLEQRGFAKAACKMHISCAETENMNWECSTAPASSPALGRECRQCLRWRAPACTTLEPLIGEKVWRIRHLLPDMFTSADTSTEAPPYSDSGAIFGPLHTRLFNGLPMLAHRTLCMSRSPWSCRKIALQLQASLGNDPSVAANISAKLGSAECRPQLLCRARETTAGMTRNHCWVQHR